jgi:hypothetical protein
MNVETKIEVDIFGNNVKTYEVNVSFLSELEKDVLRLTLNHFGYRMIEAGKFCPVFSTQNPEAISFIKNWVKNRKK